MQYQVKWTPEILWSLFYAVLFETAQILYTTDFERITDWRSWAISFGVSLGRLLIGKLIEVLASGRTPLPTAEPHG